MVDKYPARWRIKQQVDAPIHDLSIRQHALHRKFGKGGMFWPYRIEPIAERFDLLEKSICANFPVLAMGLQ